MSLLAIITDHASPELSPGVSTRWRGQVDRFDPIAGIEGWALALDRPEMRLELELTVGEDAFALGQTGRPRGDVANRLSESCLPGFHFDAGVFARLARLGSHRSGLPVGVRIAGTETRLLPSAGVNPTVGELVEAWRASVLAALASSEPRVTKGDRLLGRLSAFRAEAELTARTPLRPFSDNEIGQIDAVHLAAEGQVWFLGSMKRGTEPEFPAVVADRQKYAAGIAVLHYERQDLPSGSVGVVGVMDTGWTPPALSKDGFLYVGRQGQYHLRFGTHTRLLRTDAFLAAYGQVQAIAGGLSAEAIGQVLGAGSTWLVGNAAAAGIVAEGGIDRLLMLPGFGCLAEGWAVSPAKRVETFHMKIGDCVLTAEAESTSFRPRPDLQSVFGGSSAVTQRAGFTAALRGALPAEASGVPLLRIVHDDGSMSVQRVEAKALRRLDPVADGEEVLRLFPALRFEPFYPAFLKAIDRQIAERTREPAVLGEAMPAEKLLVVRLPAEQANLRLVFDHLARRLPDLATGTGVALLCDGGAGRGEARLLYRELKAASAAPLSLFALPHEEDGVAELPFLLSHLRAERFLYVGRGLALTAEGWGSVDASLSRRGHFVDRFEIVDDNGLPDRVDGALGVACFGWSTAALLGWSRTAPRSLRGAFRSGGLPQAPGRDRVVPGAAIRLERPKASRLADMVDEDLCAFAQSGEEAV